MSQSKQMEKQYARHMADGREAVLIQMVEWKGTLYKMPELNWLYVLLIKD